jgi:hypothetical protein
MVSPMAGRKTAFAFSRPSLFPRTQSKWNFPDSHALILVRQFATLRDLLAYQLGMGLRGAPVLIELQSSPTSAQMEPLAF